MRRELDPIVCNPNNAENLWRNIVVKICNEPEGILPVFLFNAKHIKMGEFMASLVTEEGKVYFQLEDFDSPEFADAVMQTSTSAWQINPGGIYRIELHNVRI